MKEPLRKEISEYCNSVIKAGENSNQLNEATAAFGGVRHTAPTDEIRGPLNTINTYLWNGEVSKALNAAERSSRDENPSVRAVFEGVHTFLCRNSEPAKESKSDNELNELKAVVVDLKGKLRAIIDDNPDNFSDKERSALIAIVASAESAIDKLQKNSFANSSTVVQAKKEVMSSLKSFERSVAVKNIFTKVSDLGSAIKDAFSSAIQKVRMVALPAVAKQLFEASSATRSEQLGSLKATVQGFKEQVAPKGPK